MEKKITVKEFIEKYNNINDINERNDYINSIVYRKYAPVLEKRIVLQTLLDKSIMKNEFDVDYIDLFISRINFAFAILTLYTNFDLKHTDDPSSVFDDYDILKQYNIIDQICEYVGELEIKELGILNSILIDTYNNRTGTIKSIVLGSASRFAKDLGAMTNSAITQLITIINDKDKINNILSNVNEAINNQMK